MGTMRFYADLHIHSRYSGGTSKNMNIEEIVNYASMKGLSLLGTGDALHPSWFRELDEALEEIDDSGFYKLKHRDNQDVFFIYQTEVATVHRYKEKVRKIHHVILMSSKDVAKQIADMLSRFGELESDGRPTFSMIPAELVDIVLSVDENNLIFPAHAWTPWWSIFGSFSGVDSLEEAYDDRASKIYALETGLSSDPPMNWRVSSLDRLTLLSFSDAHSPYPFRIGREAVLFELNAPSFKELSEAIRRKDRNKILMTIEVPPAYGKYHWSGHRNCNVGPLSPEEAKNLGYKCVVCGRKLTKGVDDRVNELADRPLGYRPEGAIDFVYMLPLQELIAVSLGIEPEAEHRLMSGKVWREYEAMIAKFGNEFKILSEVQDDILKSTLRPELFELISSLRSGKLEIVPGFDGVYGKIVIKEKDKKQESFSKRDWSKLEDFFSS